MSTIRSRSLVAVIATGSLCLGTAIAEARDVGSWPSSKLIHGDYGMTLSQTCVLTPFQIPPSIGFDPDTRRLLTDGEINSAVSSGVMRFNKEGEVAIEEGRLTEVLNNKLQPADVPVVAGSEYTCKGSYELHTAGKLSMELACDVKSPRPGVAITIEAVKLEGFIGRRKQNINLSSIEGNIQTVNVSVGDRLVQQRERICIQSVVLSNL